MAWPQYQILYTTHMTQEDYNQDLKDQAKKLLNYRFDEATFGTETVGLMREFYASTNRMSKLAMKIAANQEAAIEYAKKKLAR